MWIGKSISCFYLAFGACETFAPNAGSRERLIFQLPFSSTGGEGEKKSKVKCEDLRKGRSKMPGWPITLLVRHTAFAGAFHIFNVLKERSAGSFEWRRLPFGSACGHIRIRHRNVQSIGIRIQGDDIVVHH